MTTENTESQDGDAVSSLSSSDMFGDECSEIVIKLQMVAYKEDKEAFEKHLMGKLKTMLEDGENTFYPHKLVSVKYEVELRRVKLSPNRVLEVTAKHEKS